MVFSFTPLGRADEKVREYLEDEWNELDVSSYEDELAKYRKAKLVQLNIRVLLYAGLITSIAASFGLGELKIIERIASFVGVGFLFILYVFVSYLVLLYKESYHVEREALLAKALGSD